MHQRRLPRHRPHPHRAPAGPRAQDDLNHLTAGLTRSHHAAPVSYQHLADTLGLPLGARPPLEEAAAALLADREARGLALPDGGLDARQAGSVFLNPTITPAQAATVHAAGGPVHRGGDASLRASAGWLLEHVGHRPSSRIVPGVHCSTRRSLTLTAHPGATATAFTEALQLLVLQVFTTTGIRLTPELTLVG
ncbi:hypothetical protein [Streptomyces thermolineatus]|uniref:hypothetical protein n=1 Tax=Streptomyces thermolineatus TaxID=44033 RepID=UPI003850F1D2